MAMEAMERMNICESQKKKADVGSLSSLVGRYGLMKR